MLHTRELPECIYTSEPVLITPENPIPNHSLYLSNLDNQQYLVKYLFVFKKRINVDDLKRSLSRVLVDYYPLAGRLRMSGKDDQRLELDCNGEGVVFVEGNMDISLEEFMGVSRFPNSSWGKLLYSVESESFLDSPSLIVQVTNLRCGGIILCVAINHCLCDGIGTSQFLHAWAHLSADPMTEISTTPSHSRHLLKPRNPPRIISAHPQYYRYTPTDNTNPQYVFGPLVTSSLTFTHSDILHLKKQCGSSLKCTSFEALASHTWRSWAKSLGLDRMTHVKLLFSVNIRRKMEPELPQGYYGNAFVLGCAVSQIKDLVDVDLQNSVKLVQQAKSNLNDEYVRSVIDLLEDKTVNIDISRSLIISQWTSLGLQDLDFREGKPLHISPLSSDIFCLFLPVIGEIGAVRVLISLPESSIDIYESSMLDMGMDYICS